MARTREDDTPDAGLRLDKWLWAARFYKTRTLAKTAIENGKVRVGDQRAKPSRDVAIGMVLRIRQDWLEREIVITALSDQRRGAPEAARLYAETAASIAQRERQLAERSADRAGQPRASQRPTKKQRRQLQDLPDREPD